ncbi:uncharacterized protein LOC121713329 [Alosa sapidissima]|uniref:uncharacterized protein LOC121713329 n=1 Tax=Alosa sapidissima TaxID=34773 RepID=UPI001C0A2539|nr:uncharacterized protein LOC121713329 [Alosa sapidissima]XP_041953796.1 uncharacterized protein LOC121713329 [Alosa sapidissima]
MWHIWLFKVAVYCGYVVASAETDKRLEEKGQLHLQRLQQFASQPRYGECWSRALEKIHTRCREFTDETQNKIALAFTHCHLRRSDRPFPECPEGSEIRFCTRDMDPVAFNTYTEFFTHAHSICHYLQSERWQHRAENTIHRLTESSAGVAERLVSTQRMAEDLMKAQNAALRSQETILRNGEDLKTTLLSSTQGMRNIFEEMSSSVREQQVAFAEIFNRVAFLQSFIMSESHTLSCVLYNSLAFIAAFLLTSAQRISRARFVLFGLVALNVYLERWICKTVLDGDNPGYQQMEQIGYLVAILRRTMVLIGLLVLVYVAVRYRNVNRESLEILNQLKETHSNLQQALYKAECLSEAVGGQRHIWKDNVGSPAHSCKSSFQNTALTFMESPSLSESHEGWLHESIDRPGQASASHESRRSRRSSGSRVKQSSALVYSVMVEDKQQRYSLRSRKSLSTSNMTKEND